MLKRKQSFLSNKKKKNGKLEKNKTAALPIKTIKYCTSTTI